MLPSQQEDIKDVHASVEILLPAGIQSYVIGAEVSVLATDIMGSIPAPERILKNEPGSMTSCPLTPEVSMVHLFVQGLNQCLC